jgi:hypothetical protein
MGNKTLLRNYPYRDEIAHRQYIVFILHLKYSNSFSVSFETVSWIDFFVILVALRNRNG